MISQSRSARQDSTDLAKRDLAEYGAARFRDQVFDAVLALWRRRKSEGWSQKKVAEAIGRDPAWVSRNLRAPGNWTMRIAGELIQGLDGEGDVRVVALEDAPETPTNFDAYEGYICSTTRPEIETVRLNTLPQKFTQISVRPERRESIRVTVPFVAQLVMLGTHK